MRTIAGAILILAASIVMTGAALASPHHEWLFIVAIIVGVYGILVFRIGWKHDNHPPMV